MYGLCIDPEVLYPAVMRLLAKYGVRLLLNTTVVGVKSSNGVVSSLQLAGRGGTSSIDCNCIVDASGGGNITAMAGGEVITGDKEGRFQPVSLTFRMADVEYEPLLRFIRDNPDEALLSENPVLPKDPATAAAKLYEAGMPYVAISAKGTVLGEAIREGSVHQSTAAFITPTSVRRQEVCINSTRVSGIDCTEEEVVSGVLFELSEQMVNFSRFLRQRVPGFENSSVSSIAHRVGVRETGRIRGEYTLTQDDVINAVRHKDSVARGCHHVDIHGEGTSQVRIPVKDGKAYDIPYRCLIPVGLKNVIAAGRCLSSDRGANGSARVMGTCLATGQAAGAAAALYTKEGHADFRDINTEAIMKLNQGS